MKVIIIFSLVVLSGLGFSEEFEISCDGEKSGKVIYSTTFNKLIAVVFENSGEKELSLLEGLGSSSFDESIDLENSNWLTVQKTQKENFFNIDRIVSFSNGTKKNKLEKPSLTIIDFSDGTYSYCR